MPDTVVVGAGIAGIACARGLHRSGRPTLVLDKGRGIGGRLATRRVSLPSGDIRFDHGTQYLSVRDDAFAQVLDAAGAGLWADWGTGLHRVGVPGMSALPRALAQGVQIRQQIEVTGLTEVARGWQVTTGDASLTARRVVLTLPAPQAARLLGVDHPLAKSLATVRMAPCLTLMAAFPPDSPRPFVSRRDAAHPLAWVAQDSSKPGRSATAVTWVAQAGPDWSAAHLEVPPADSVALMLSMLCDVTGADPQSVLYAHAHRWRYAHTTQPLGQPFLRSADRSLYLGGDWCLGPRVEHAWASGSAISRDILEQPDVD